MIRSYEFSLKDAEISIKIDSEISEFKGLAAVAMLVATSFMEMYQDKKLSKKEKAALSAYLHGVAELASRI